MPLNTGSIVSSDHELFFSAVVFCVLNGREAIETIPQFKDYSNLYLINCSGRQ